MFTYIFADALGLEMRVYSAVQGLTRRTSVPIDQPTTTVLLHTPEQQQQQPYRRSFSVVLLVDLRYWSLSAFLRPLFLISSSGLQVSDRDLHC